MTEAEWLACVQPSVLIESVGHRVWDERRGLLFAVECCRRLPVIPDARLHGVIEKLERVADELATENELYEATRTAYDVVEWEARHDMSSSRYHAAEVVLAAASYPTEEYTAISAFVECAEADCGPGDGTIRRRLYEAFAGLVREMVGNPFRSVTFNPDWRTTDVMLLAQRIYESREFGAMPILADALQDAGCDSDDILDHMRDTTAPHVRGCWALDLVLGKS
jgi:hypothetical protein